VMRPSLLLIPAALVAAVAARSLAHRYWHRGMEEEAARLAQLIKHPVARFRGSDEALPLHAARRRASADKKRQDADRIMSRPASTDEGRIITFTRRR
jgi:hypothetical protein